MGVEDVVGVGVGGDVLTIDGMRRDSSLKRGRCDTRSLWNSFGP